MSELVLNPRVRIRPVQADGRVTAYAISAPVKGRGKLESKVAIGSAHAAVIDVLQGLVAADDDVEVCDDACAALLDLGVLVHDHEVSQPVRFACRPGGERQAGATSWIVNPDVSVIAFDELAAREPGLARVLAPSAYVVLVGDPASGARSPYAIDAHDRALIERLTPDAPPPAELAGAELGRLSAAGVLLDERALADADASMRASAAQFAAHGYAVVRRSLPLPQVAALRDYYRGLVDEGYAAHQDDQVEERSVLYNEQLMQYFHRELCRVFARVSASAIKPSYAYFAAYRRGATLEKHCDRAQCKLTASLLLDYATRPGDDPVWPLYLELPATGELVSVELSVGECVLFSGQVQPHFRRELRAEGSTSLLFHYVDETFSGSLQ